MIVAKVESISEASIGPHEGHELVLMKAGTKPLSMFLDDGSPDLFPEEEFDRAVAEGALVKRVHNEVRSGLTYRRIFYALPKGQWRIEAMLMVLAIHSAGWHPDIERVVGTLLGYERADIEAFIQRIQSMRL